jgi:hypothetical protein
VTEDSATNSFTVINLQTAQIFQVNVTKKESTYVVNGLKEIAVVCGAKNTTCIGLVFEGGVLVGQRNVSLKGESGQVKMVEVNQPFV